MRLPFTHAAWIALLLVGLLSGCQTPDSRHSSSGLLGSSSEVRSALGDTAGAKEDQTRVDEMEQDIPQPTEGIEENIKKKMQQMDPYKVFYNE